MRRLGYTRFVAQGGDWGAQITDVMGAGASGAARHPLQHARHCSARRCRRRSRLGGPAAVRPLGRRAARVRPAGLPLHEGYRVRTEMANRPQTLYGLADSPVGLAAWMLDHDAHSHEDIARPSRAPGRQPHPGRGPRQHHADLVTNTGVSSARLYWENKLGFFDVKGVSPGGRERLPQRALPAPRSWTEQAYPKLIYFNEVDKGDHFAAWQEPELFTDELRAAFRSLR